MNHVSSRSHTLFRLVINIKIIKNVKILKIKKKIKEIKSITNSNDG